MKSRKVIALIDPFAGGHHLAFIRLFAKTILELNFDVWIFYPEINEVMTKGYEVDKAFENRIKLFSFPVKKAKIKIRNRFKGSIETFLFWKSTASLLKGTEKNERKKISSVFFAWLDEYVANYMPYQAVDFIFRYNWSGLYFHPWYLFNSENQKSTISSIDYVLKSKRCTGVALHDEFLLEVLERRINKPTIFFPEIADQTDPLTYLPLVSKVKALAAGRKIVGLIGLAKRKGFLGLLNLIEKSPSDRFYFFLAGPVNDTSFSLKEQNRINQFISSLPENVIFFPGYFKEGAEINTVIKAFDILYLVYDNFKSSSNFNTKAAFFRKPVLATESFWIGNVTRKYNLGITVPEDDSQKIAKGLLMIEDLIDNNKWNPSLEEYMQKNGDFALKEAFKRILLQNGK